MFETLKNWTLLRGSHPFPSGGSCFNEVAAVVAGYPYRAVNSYRDMPETFCPVITAITMTINDASDTGRQKLIPYITRVIGVADTPEIERQRAKAFAQACGCPVIYTSNRRTVWDSIVITLPLIQQESVGEIQIVHDVDPIATINSVINRIYYRDIFGFAELALNGLDAALAIGKQADPLDNYLVEERVESLKSVSMAPNYLPVGSDIKYWNMYSEMSESNMKVNFFDKYKSEYKPFVTFNPSKHGSVIEYMTV